jgi:hypothetical protein
MKLTQKCDIFGKIALHEANATVGRLSGKVTFREANATGSLLMIWLS